MKNQCSFLICLSLAYALFFTSCKEKEPTIAQITVVDKNSSPVSGAKVKVYCSPSPCDVTDTQTSDGSGITNHEFKLPAVLKILATATITITDNTTIPPTSVLDTLIGESYIELKEEETVQQTVIML